MFYELMGRAHAAWAAERGQGTVEYVGLVLLMAVLIAGVVKASGSFSDTGIAEAVVKRLKAAMPCGDLPRGGGRRSGAEADGPPAPPTSPAISARRRWIATALSG